MESPSLLIVTRYFPPLDSIASLRLYSWAKYLDREGWCVSVLTTSKKGQVVQPLNLDICNFNVAELDYFDPICFLGGKKKLLIPEHHRTPEWNSPLKKIKRTCVNLYRTRLNERLPGRTDPWIWPAIQELRKQKSQGVHYDSIISSYGPPSAHIIGHYAKKLFGCCWLADYRDLWLENHVYRGLWPFTILERFVEKRCVGKADLLTTVSNSHRDCLQQKFPHIPVHTITNGFDAELIDRSHSGYFARHEKAFRIVYTGSIYPQVRDPSPLFKAISELIEEQKIHSKTVQVLFYGSIQDGLQELITTYKLHQSVHLCESVALSEAYSIQKSADALLFLESPSPKIEGVLTGKLFEYLYADVPIIAIGVTRTMEAGHLIENCGAGRAFGYDISAIKNHLLELIQGSHRMTRNWDLIQRYSRQTQAKYIAQLLGNHSRSH